MSKNMNNVYFALIFFSAFVSRSQSLRFSYDANGNQIERKLVLIQMQSFSNAVYSEEENVLFSVNSEDVRKLEMIEEIEVFPNPVIDWVTMQWNEEMNVSAIELFDNNGKFQFSRVITFGKSELFDLSQYPAGVYFFRIIGKKGEQKTVKIVKK